MIQDLCWANRQAVRLEKEIAELRKESRKYSSYDVRKCNVERELNTRQRDLDMLLNVITRGEKENENSK